MFLPAFYEARSMVAVEGLEKVKQFIGERLPCLYIISGLTLRSSSFALVLIIYMHLRNWEQ